MAKLRGARVIATCSDHKAHIAREAGADEVLGYANFDEATKQLTGGRGVDCVYDSVGKDTFERSLNCLRPRGLLALFGQASGAVSPFDPQILNAKGSLYLTRPSLGHYIQTRSELLSRTDEIFGWVAAGTLKAKIDREFALAEAPSAHTALNSRETMGKVLLIP
jgi:NADPH2:quinone reductase